MLLDPFTQKGVACRNPQLPSRGLTTIRSPDRYCFGSSEPFPKHNPFPLTARDAVNGDGEKQISARSSVSPLPVACRGPDSVVLSLFQHPLFAEPEPLSRGSAAEQDAVSRCESRGKVSRRPPPRDPNTSPKPTTTSMSAQIFEVNPYENHPELTQTEADLLWEYAKLNQRLKIVSVSDISFRR